MRTIIAFIGLLFVTGCATNYKVPNGSGGYRVTNAYEAWGNMFNQIHQQQTQRRQRSLSPQRLQPMNNYQLQPVRMPTCTTTKSMYGNTLKRCY